MKHYYYADNDQQLGPFTIEELRTKRLKKSTLVWTEGMQDWTTANEIEELKDILISEPPPLPKKATATPTVETIQIKQAPIPVTSSKYDLTYAKESDATFLGVILLVVPIALKLSGVFTFETEESYNIAKAFFAIVSVVIRIAVTIWVVNIASRQNRNSTSWGWFAFFLPSIALIVIGQLKKLRLQIELDGSLPANQQVAILLDKASKLFSDNRYTECVEILNKTIEIDCKNIDSIRLRALANYHLEKYGLAKTDFEVMVKERKFLSEAYYYLGNIFIENFDREEAVSHWLKAKEFQNDKAQIQLDFYHTYTGKYLLDNSQVSKKINNNSDYFLTIGDEKYKGGISEIDKTEKIEKLTTIITGYKKGLHIELSRTFKKYHIVIAFYEIDDIKYYLNDKTFELYLMNGVLLKFTYDQSKHDGNRIKELCHVLENVTGKKIEAISSWNE